MARGAASPKVTQAINNLYKTALANQSDDYRRVAILSEILRQLDLLTQDRRVRITFAEGIVPGVVWAVLLFGAVATVSFTFFFGTLIRGRPACHDWAADCRHLHGAAGDLID